MDSELKKTSVRANRLEKKRFEMTMSSFETAKRNVAVDMKKSQVDFKRRLKRYKDRQREIVSARSQDSSGNMEEFLLQQLRRRNHLNHKLRPQTTPAAHLLHRGAGHGASGNYNSDDLGGCGSSEGCYGSSGSDDVSGSGSGVTAGGSSGSGGVSGTSTGRCSAAREAAVIQSIEKEEEDIAKLSHCRRSKIDLRPCTAWSVAYNRTGKLEHGTRGNAPNMRLLQLRGGNLGTPARQTRYFDDEEIEERCTFYRFLLDGYRQTEHKHLQVLNERVGQFCGKKRPESSCPPLVKVGVVSLPENMPPILRHAMSAGGARIGVWGKQQRAKIH